MFFDKAGERYLKQFPMGKEFDSSDHERLNTVVQYLKVVRDVHHSMLEGHLQGIPPTGVLFTQKAMDANDTAIEILEDILRESDDERRNKRWRDSKSTIFKVFDVIYKGMKILEMMGLGGGDSGLLSLDSGEPDTDTDR